MNYFKVLGIIFGLAALLKPLYMHILPWDENKFIKKAYSEKRPKWIVPVAILGFCMVALTWYMELTTDIQYSMILSILFSLTLVKAIFFIFDYEKFHKWVASMLSKDNGKQIVLIDIGASIFGLVVVLVAVILY